MRFDLNIILNSWYILGTQNFKNKIAYTCKFLLSSTSVPQPFISEATNIVSFVWGGLFGKIVNGQKRVGLEWGRERLMTETSVWWSFQKFRLEMKAWSRVLSLRMQGRFSWKYFSLCFTPHVQSIYKWHSRSQGWLKFCLETWGRVRKRN